MPEAERVLGIYGAILVVTGLLVGRLGARHGRPWPHAVPTELRRYLASVAVVLGAVLLALSVIGPRGPGMVIAVALPPLVALIVGWWRRAGAP